MATSRRSPLKRNFTHGQRLVCRSSEAYLLQVPWTVADRTNGNLGSWQSRLFIKPSHILNNRTLRCLHWLAGSSIGCLATVARRIRVTLRTTSPLRSYTRKISAMLVLSRKKNEAIHIGIEGIVITVVEIRGQQVRIGIEAPADVPIRRQEILHRDIPKHLLVSVETRRENRLNSMATRATS